ncbi:60 kDa SS-A/Ro ribonucleoprotein-like [Homalodisca vitripennis]|uniref:60 kDa SS-A/Ro ribonucleoprotein-like n=1 Tax=Homalodisca vitripennis TaxID=197043 RepID=UPI001EE9C74E|nr:60 kDa SS-A/Ro ribonucleoprotein-like [Homalodisca vitripennis]
MSTSRELLEMRFKRFLHYGSEQPIYKAGERVSNKYYDLEKIPSLIKLINGQIHQSVIEIITKVAKEESSLWPDSVTYALAYCSHQDFSPELKNEAYKILRTVCKTARDIILFVKFHRELRGTKGGGNGFKRAVGQWYLVWMPFDLADILLHQKSYHGWKHTDVLRIAHIKPISIEQQLLFTYATRGLKEATTRFGESPNEQVQELLEYITTVESFRKIKEPEKAARALAVELHNLERVPTNLLKYQEIWNELITHMDVKTLLDNLQRLSILGFLKNNTVTVLKVVDVFNNLWKAETFKGHPSRVYIELLTYEKAAKYCLEIANKMNHPVSNLVPPKKPPKCNLVIKSALITFFYSLFKVSG